MHEDEQKTLRTLQVSDHSHKTLLFRKRVQSLKRVFNLRPSQKTLQNRL